MKSILLNPVSASALKKRKPRKTSKSKAKPSKPRKEGGMAKKKAAKRKAKARKPRPKKRVATAKRRVAPKKRAASKKRAAKTMAAAKKIAPKGQKKAAKRKRKAVPTGSAMWKRRYKRGMQKALSRMPVSRWREATMAGVGAYNLAPQEWVESFEKAVGVPPSVRGPAPGSKGWWSKMVKGTRGKAKKYESKTAGKGAKWEKGILAAARKAGAAAGSAAGKKAAANPYGRRGAGLMKSSSRGMKGRAGMARYYRNRMAYNPMSKGRKYSKKRRRNPYTTMRRNPVMGTLKQLFSAEAMKEYGYVGAGFVAGAVLPNLASRLLAKLKVLESPSMPVEVLLGGLSSAAAGIVTGAITKDVSKAQKVTAGGIAGIIGGLVLPQINKLLDEGVATAGLGRGAESLVERAVEAELQKELGPMSGLGQFVTEGEVEREVAGLGLGQFITETEVEDAPSVAGLGTEAGEDMEEANGFGY